MSKNILKEKNSNIIRIVSHSFQYFKLPLLFFEFLNLIEKDIFF